MAKNYSEKAREIFRRQDYNEDDDIYCPSCGAYLPFQRSWAQHLRYHPECDIIANTKHDEDDSILGSLPSQHSQIMNNNESHTRVLKSVDSVLGRVNEGTQKSFSTKINNNKCDATKTIDSTGLQCNIDNASEGNFDFGSFVSLRLLNQEDTTGRGNNKECFHPDVIETKEDEEDENVSLLSLPHDNQETISSGT